MLLLCDESTRYKVKIIGAISISVESFLQFENYALEQRVKQNVYGEVKWQKVGCRGKYFDFYIDLVTKLFSFPEVRFHSNSYEGHHYKAGYALLRSIVWKLQNARIPTGIYILHDKSNYSEIKTIKEYLRVDRRVKREIVLCEEIKSETFVTLGVVDILAGCTSFVLNKVSENAESESNLVKADFITGLENKVNNGIPFGVSISKLWDYSSDNLFQNFALHDRGM
ncbi:MAG: hypothetical protein UT53_C0006G0009 [Candidatus Yanofskybacteria bacterium GW2011_GWD2_39_48]|uniref:DUF3800 domain-containing protein n=1 Tax=Candidatus Yanofskybacteria bacterium GW2011_GWD2_39_48 TaxID=1619031 RepID=A0A0G0P6F6_9BACT|nr:MAG: hypothetical protein UT53_C0006G0009 [Candidatus Yanofskybacteria bacterium GW2011_GWD2_39_48]